MNYPTCKTNVYVLWATLIKISRCSLNQTLHHGYCGYDSTSSLTYFSKAFYLFHWMQLTKGWYKSDRIQWAGMSRGWDHSWMLHCPVPWKMSCWKHELEIQSKCSFEVLCNQPLVFKKIGKLLLFCTSDDISCSVCLLTFQATLCVCELEWNRTCCHDNHTRGVPSLENRSSQPITDLHAVEDAGRKRAHCLSTVLPLFIQYTSMKIKYHYKVHTQSSAATQNDFAGTGLEFSSFTQIFLIALKGCLCSYS